MFRTVVAWSRRLAPVCCAALLAAILGVGGVDAVERAGADRYFAEVRRAVDRIPYRIGPWVGSDVEPLEGAVRLLKPNALMQRRYVDPSSGRSVSLLVVHTGDVRDMVGHYPPVCYPAHGWREENARPLTLASAGRELPARSYTFNRIEEGLTRSLQVISFFVLPGEAPRIVRDMEAVRDVAQRRPEAKLGAAQIQLVASEGLEGQQGQRLTEQFIEAIEPVVRSIGKGFSRE